MPYQYTVIRSQRKTIALQITRDLEIRVRAPLKMGQKEIASFVEQHSAWIEEHLQSQQKRREAHPEPDLPQEIALRRRAATYIPPKVAHYAALMQLYPTSLKITAARTRFGSCSTKNGICFSWRLMHYPEAAIDYVIVHELAHIAHKNHSREFYALIASILPDYQERRALLKE